ncbi:MAG: 3-phosphoshikimate 1-carboxyvinyltransferase [Patescibacteria group bacterium]
MNIHILPGKVNGTLIAPPSKSCTHRAVILATLAEGESVIENCLLADDTRMTIEACAHFGTEIASEGNKSTIRGVNGLLHVPSHPIDCGFSGTTLRFMLALAAMAPGETVLTGSARLMGRPLKPLLNALEAIGGRFMMNETNISISGKRLKGGRVMLPGDVSSQFVSALLMIAPFTQESILITVEEPFYSRPYVDLTIVLMHEFGVDVVVQDNRFTVEPGQDYRARVYTIEGDYSSAQYWFAAAAMTGGEVKVEGLNPHSHQGDKRLLNILHNIGCVIKIGSDAITVQGRKLLKPFSVDGRDIPDLVPTLAVLAAAAQGISSITHVGHLRGKESDRLSVPVEELKKMGIKVEIVNNSLRIRGGQLKGAVIDPHGDHRIAMAFAVAGLAAEGETVITDAEVVSKSYPGFWNDFKKIQFPS